MPKIIVESSSGKREFDAPNGGKIVDLCDATEAPIPFSCRGASCGTCRIDVFEGADLLEAPEDEELDVLDIFGDNPKERRLACQAKMKTANGLVRVRPVDE